MEPEVISSAFLEEKRQRAEDAMRSNEIRDKWMTRLMIFINLGITLFVSLILTAIFLLIRVKFSPHSVNGGVLITCIVLGFCIGCLLWSQILFRTRIFDYFFINVKQNWIVILGNQIQYDNIPDNPNDRIKLFERGALREVGQGIRGKWPWEVMVDSINLRSDVMLGPGDKETKLRCVTSDDIQLDIGWQVVMTPLVGFGVNLVRRNQDAIEAYFKGIFDQKIIAWVRGHTEEQVFAMLNDLKEAFKNALGGSGNVSEEEMDWGTFTNDPQIISVTRNAAYQEAAEGKMVGKKLIGVIDDINKAFQDRCGTTPNPDMVLATSASVIGKEIPGLLLLAGVEKDQLPFISKMGVQTAVSKKENNKKQNNEKKGDKKHE